MIVNKVELKIRVFFPKKSKLLNLPQSFLYSVKGRSAIPEITQTTGEDENEYSIVKGLNPRVIL